MADPISRTLRAMKRRDGERTKAKLSGKNVRIWSGEHHAWWRPEGEGYTDFKEAAGIWQFEDAYRRTYHCGPEKRIVYVEVLP